MLIGETFANYEIWDAMRGVDYLDSLPDVDPHRIGALGCSGGGTVTALTGALDTRIAAIGTACYITSFDALLPRSGRRTPSSPRLASSPRASAFPIGSSSPRRVPTPSSPPIPICFPLPERGKRDRSAPLLFALRSGKRRHAVGGVSLPFRPRPPTRR